MSLSVLQARVRSLFDVVVDDDCQTPFILDNILMAEEIPEAKVFATFERFNEFRDLQKEFLTLDLQDEPGIEAENKEFLTQQTLCAVVHPNST